MSIAAIAFYFNRTSPPSIKVFLSDFIEGDVFRNKDLNKVFMGGGFIMVFNFFLSKSVKLCSV